MTRHSIPSSNFLCLGTIVLVAAIAEVAPSAASATPVTSAANIPYSGISPGGVNMATGELILSIRELIEPLEPSQVGKFFAGLRDDEFFTDIPAEIEYGRYYGSMLAREGLATGHLGTNWLGTYDWSLSVTMPMVTIVTNRGQRIQFQQSPGGAWDLVAPTDQKYRLDFVGGMWRLTHPGLRRVFLFHGTTLLLTQILDAHGNSLNLSYSGGLLAQVSDGLGRMLTFSYDGSGRVTQVGDGTRVVSYAYTGDDLTSVTDAEGHTWTYTYAQPGPIQGLLTGVTEPLGNSPLTHAYDLLGRVISQADALGAISTYTWNGLDNFYVDEVANQSTFWNDSQGRLLMLTDPAGGMTSFTYDPPGRLATMTRPLRNMTSFAYDPASGYPSRVTFADGAAINWGYSSHSVGGATLFDLATASYPDGTTESYGRDASGNLTNFTDRGGFPWGGTYNSRGQLLTATNPSGGVATFTYDPQARPATWRDNAGNTTQYTYDAVDRLTQITWPDGPARSFTYDNVDHVTGVTDERGKPSSYAYDDNGRLVTATDPLLEATGFVYDALDRVTQVVDPLGHATVYAYDPAGRLMSTTDRSGRTTGYQYDTLGRLTGIVDPMGGTSTFTYDADSRVIGTQDPLGHAASFGHDLLDRITHITDPVGTGFDYTYDTMGRLLTANAPLGHAQSFGYDPRGLLTSFFDATSETDFPRTPLGQVSQLTDPNRNNWPRRYDPQGRLTSAADPLARTTSYEYDSRSRPIQIGRADGSAQQITYDPAGQVTGESYSDATTFTYGYDDANRLLNATGASFSYDAAGRMTSSNGLMFTYDPEGRILSETLASGKVVSYGYDSRGLLSEVQDWMGGTTSFTYDAAWRLTGITRPNGTSATYQYDAADRLIGAVEKDPEPVGTPLATIALTRDALGQPTSISRRQPLMPGTTTPGSTEFTYDPASQINGISHDPLGRTTSVGSRAFQWDGASRLTHYAAGADSPRFTYDAFGRMLSRTQGTASEQYVWNYATGVPSLVEKNPGPSQSSYFVHTPSGVPLYRVDPSGARYFYHYDEVGNAMFLTNGAGSVSTEYAYNPYGGVAALGSTADNTFTWGAAAGAIQLGSSGLFRMGGEIYDTMTMRVISGNAIRSGPAGVGDRVRFEGGSLWDNDDGMAVSGSVHLAAGGLSGVLAMSPLIASGIVPVGPPGVTAVAFHEPGLPSGFPRGLPPGPCSPGGYEIVRHASGDRARDRVIPGSWVTVNPEPQQSPGEFVCEPGGSITKSLSSKGIGFGSAEVGVMSGSAQVSRSADGSWRRVYLPGPAEAEGALVVGPIRADPSGVHLAEGAGHPRFGTNPDPVTIQGFAAGAGDAMPPSRPTYKYLFTHLWPIPGPIRYWHWPPW